MCHWPKPESSGVWSQIQLENSQKFWSSGLSTGPVLFTIFTKDLDECTLTQFTDETMLYGSADLFESSKSLSHVM